MVHLRKTNFSGKFCLTSLVNFKEAGKDTVTVCDRGKFKISFALSECVKCSRKSEEYVATLTVLDLETGVTYSGKALALETDDRLQVTGNFPASLFYNGKTYADGTVNIVLNLSRIGAEEHCKYTKWSSTVDIVETAEDDADTKTELSIVRKGKGYFYSRKRKHCKY